MPAHATRLELPEAKRREREGERERDRGMERRFGGCCIARYGGDADVAWKMGRIMLRFRPIAPKPESGGLPVSGSADVAGGGRAASKRRGGGGGGGRRGRKARKVAEAPEAGVVKEKQGGGEKSSSPSQSLSSSSSSAAGAGSSGSDSSSIVTLPLIPETPERREEAKPKEGTAVGHQQQQQLASVLPYVPPPPWWTRGGEGGGGGGSEVVAPRPLRPAGSWVTLEGVTDTWREGEVAAGDDAAVLEALQGDACPGFVSDQWDRVTWTNQEFRRMVLGPPPPHEEAEEDVRVALATRGLVPAEGTCRAFTCRVRVRYACRCRGKGSLAVPCDVWRLTGGGGGLAWRLDVKAALSLCSLGS